MCGVAGFSGLRGEHQRLGFALGASKGLDARGGHASGYVRATPGIKGRTRAYATVGKTLGGFLDASGSFVSGMTLSSVLLMHGRYATHGARDSVANAHPFTIKRANRTVLHGMHNGVLQGTHESAQKHGRDHTVDSLECFHILADGD